MGTALNGRTTWLLRPMLQREDSSCQPGAVHTWPIADVTPSADDVRFSNRPVGVKHFQAIHTAASMSLAGSRFSTDSAQRPFHHGIRGRGGTIFQAALSLNERQVQADLTSSIVPRGTSFHCWVDLEFSPIGFD